MFTGLIQELGEVTALDRSARTRLTVRAPGMAREPFTRGESIAVNGCCLSVVEAGGERFTVEVSPETLARTSLAALQRGARVNLERALRLSDRLGGHLVLGHVDGVGRVQGRQPAGDFLEMTVEAPAPVEPLLLEKGSVAVDGVSLTVNSVSGRSFSVMLIPETLAATTLGGKQAGDPVNLEGDVIGKYVARLVGRGARPGYENFLKEHGFA